MLASQWESRKVMTSPLAADAPSRRVLMSPSLFLVLRMRTFGVHFMYSSSGSFKCSAQRRENKIISDGHSCPDMLCNYLVVLFCFSQRLT